MLCNTVGLPEEEAPLPPQDPSVEHPDGEPRHCADSHATTG